MRTSILVILLATVACGDDNTGAVDASDPLVDAPMSIDAAAMIDATPDFDAPPDVDAGPSLFDVMGRVNEMGGTAPESGKVLVLWSVVEGSDYLYKFGEGTSTPAQFVVSFSMVPPPEALNLDSLGVGIVVLVPEAFQLADGVVLDENALVAELLGATPQHAIIYRDGATGISWEGGFPQGYSCGMCVPGMGGFDSYTPVDCSTVELLVGDINSFDFCNWT